MKHLRPFNESSTEFYQKIDTEKYRELSLQPLEFSDGEYKRIINFFYVEAYDKKYTKDNIKIGLKLNTTREKIYGSNVEIRKVKDDYFIIYIESTATFVDAYYKCDQIDGLIKCLVDNYKKHRNPWF